MSIPRTELIDKRRHLELLRKREKLREENGLAFYRPHRKQDLFHRAGNYKRRYMRTGNRFGKSQMGAAEDCAWALGERSWYPKDDPARTVGLPRHSTKGCIVVENWAKCEEIFTNMEAGTSQGKLFQYLPKDSILKVSKGNAGSIDKISVQSIYGGTSTIKIETVRSFLQHPQSMESGNYDWIHVDEPCPEAMFKALARGLIDRGGSAWFTCTPLREMWINDYFLPHHMARATFTDAYVRTEGVKGKDLAEHRWMLTGSSRDNPYITDHDIDVFLDDLGAADEASVATRIDGVPMALTGVIYKDFSHDIHIYGGDRTLGCPAGWEDEQTPPQSYTIRTLIDPHPKTPHAVLHFATSPTGHTFIFRELFRPGLIKELVEHIEAQVDGYHVEDFLVDPIAFVENPITGTCMADEFYASGLPVVPAVKDLAYGVLKTQQKWRERDPQDNPTIYVHESCDQFLYEIDRYVWDQDKEKPVDRDDHMMECLYRAVLTGLEYVDNDDRRPTPKPMDITSSSWKSHSSLLRPFDPSTDKQVNLDRRNRYR